VYLGGPFFLPSQVEAVLCWGSWSLIPPSTDLSSAASHTLKPRLVVIIFSLCIGCSRGENLLRFSVPAFPSKWFQFHLSPALFFFFKSVDGGIRRTCSFLPPIHYMIVVDVHFFSSIHRFPFSPNGLPGYHP